MTGKLPDAREDASLESLPKVFSPIEEGQEELASLTFSSAPASFWNDLGDIAPTKQSASGGQ